MIDVTHELNQFNRGLLVINCNRGILRGGKADGFVYSRRFNSDKMEMNGEVFYRTGEVEKDEHGNYHIVYKLK